MSKKRHPNECSACQKIPCQCAGGGAADENAKDENVNTEKKVDENKDGFIHDINIADIHTNDKTNVFFQEYDNKLMMSATPTPKPVANAPNARNDVEEIQNNRPAWCTLFAATANQLVLMPSSNLQQEDCTNNASSMSMGMSMSGTDE